MNVKNAYLSYEDYFLNYNTKTFKLSIGCGKDYLKGEIKPGFDFTECEVSHKLYNEGIRKTVTFKNVEKTLTLTFNAETSGIRVKSEPETKITAEFVSPDFSDTVAMHELRDKEVINCVLGNSAKKRDNMLFDKNIDSAVKIESASAFIGFDKNRNAYTLSGGADFKFSVKKDILSSQFSIPYHRINKNATFGKLPPVGWMTWYAVKFDAGEKTVTENTVCQMERLKDFGANTVWVDWEWYHKGLDDDSVRDDGVDTFHVDKVRYPNGLKAVSDKIRECGFIPSLWIGFTNETFETDYIKAHPEVLLAVEQSWVGTYFYDITHPTFLNDFLPKALAQVDEWGYEAVKFDTLPICMERTEQYHERLYDSSLTTYRAYRNMIAKTREILGKDRYILSCSGENRSEVLWAADMVEAARIGLDIFKWDEFLNNCVKRVTEFYPLNNIVLYNDPDNVVIRDEFNTYNQAVSRAVFVSMLGMPVTFGDDLPKLPPERMNILKRVIPSLDIYPKEINANTEIGEVLVTNLDIGLSFESYNVISVFNTQERETEYYLDLKKTADLEGGKYHIYDFWHDEYLGCTDSGIKLVLEPCETRVLAVRKDSGGVQILSTNRHITQGAAEIKDMRMQNDSISLKCSLVKDDLYKIALYVPQGYELISAEGFNITNKNEVTYLSFMPDKTGEYNFKINFKRS